MFKTILKIFAWLMLTAFLVFTIGFVVKEIENVNCQNVSVQIIEGSPRFLNNDDILELLKKIDNSVFGKSLKEINTEELEEKLNAVASIKNVEVFRRINGKSLEFTGKLVVEVEQRNPIIRIKTSKGDYYLDGEGVKIPVSEKFAAKVLVANGTVPDDFATDDLLRFSEFVYSNPFWKAQFEQLYVRPNKEILLIPQIGDHVIEFGKTDNYREKLRNLKAVYLKGFSKTGWDKYKTINLKYKNQVVCTKK
jgi:cell division protein FtsQ